MGNDVQGRESGDAIKRCKHQRAKSKGYKGTSQMGKLLEKQWHGGSQ